MLTAIVVMVVSVAVPRPRLLVVLPIAVPGVVAIAVPRVRRQWLLTVTVVMVVPVAIPRPRLLESCR